MASPSPPATRPCSRYHSKGSSLPTAAGSRRRKVAAASSSFLNRNSASRRTAPTSRSMRRRAPPAPTAESGRSPPSTRTSTPRSAAMVTSASKSRVETMPASSISSTSPGRILKGPALAPLVFAAKTFATVSAPIPSSSPKTFAAAAVGAMPITRPPAA